MTVDVTFEPAVSGTKELNNPMLAKTGRMKWNEGYIEYTVNINPQGVSLPENFVLPDQFSPTLQLDSESVKLYSAAVTGTDTAANPSFNKQEEEITGLVLDNRPAEHSFSVIIPEGTKSCILTYRADVISQTDPYENHIAMGTGGEGGQGGSGNSGSGVSMGTGGAAATRKNKGIVSLTKTGSLTGEAMAGVEFQLLQDGQPVARGVTDGEGELEFLGLKLGKYILEEVGIPEDYIPASLKVTSPEGLAVAGNQVEIKLTGESKEIVLALTDDPVTVNVEF